MREFFFRGKRTDNGEWVCGYYTKARYFLNKKEMHIIFEPDVEAFPHCEFTGYEEVLPETVGQYTGLTDKNGTKIFEGDIVLYGTNTNRAKNKETHEVVFETRGESGYFGIRISEIETWQFCLEVPAKLMEVIGNIHDNPELLGGENNGINR